MINLAKSTLSSDLFKRIMIATTRTDERRIRGKNGVSP
jgi:hypothetical protein